MAKPEQHHRQGGWKDTKITIGKSLGIPGRHDDACHQAQVVADRAKIEFFKARKALAVLREKFVSTGRIADKARGACGRCRAVAAITGEVPKPEPVVETTAPSTPETPSAP